MRRSEEVLGEYFASLLLTSGDDVELGDVTFNELSFEDLGDDSAAFRLTVPLSQDGFDVDVYLDFVAVVQDRAKVTTTFLSFYSPFDEAESLELTELVVDRV